MATFSLTMNKNLHCIIAKQSLFNGISTLFRLFNAKAILIWEQLWYYLTHSWEDKEVHTFPKSVCPKVNVIARLESEIDYNDSAAHRFNHYTTKTPLCEGVVPKLMPPITTTDTVCTITQVDRESFQLRSTILGVVTGIGCTEALA